MNKFIGMFVFSVLICCGLTAAVANDCCGGKVVHVNHHNGCDCGPRCNCVNCNCGCCVKKVVHTGCDCQKNCDCCVKKVVKTRGDCCVTKTKVCNQCKPVCRCGDCECGAARVVFRPFCFVGRVCHRITHPCHRHVGVNCGCGCNY